MSTLVAEFDATTTPASGSGSKPMNEAKPSDAPLGHTNRQSLCAAKVHPRPNSIPNAGSPSCGTRASSMAVGRVGSRTHGFTSTNGSMSFTPHRGTPAPDRCVKSRSGAHRSRTSCPIGAAAPGAAWPTRRRCRSLSARMGTGGAPPGDAQPQPRASCARNFFSQPRPSSEIRSSTRSVSAAMVVLSPWPVCTTVSGGRVSRRPRMLRRMVGSSL